MTDRLSLRTTRKYIRYSQNNRTKVIFKRVIAREMDVKTSRFLGEA